MIRNAALGDVSTIAEMGERFHGAAGWDDIAKFDKASCQTTLRHMIESPDAIVLVAEDHGEIVGIAGGLAYPFYFNLSHKAGQELFLYVEPGRRDGLGGKLLRTLENEARAIGCESWAMIALDKMAPEATGRFYRQHGYRASEYSWIKRL